VRIKMTIDRNAITIHKHTPLLFTVGNLFSDCLPEMSYASHSTSRKGPRHFSGLFDIKTSLLF